MLLLFQRTIKFSFYQYFEHSVMLSIILEHVSFINITTSACFHCQTMTAKRNML